MLHFNNIRPFLKTLINNSFALIIISFLLVFQYSCDTTEPNDNLKPGRIDYTWTVDTIPVANSVMKDMWGSTPNDIWICGDGYDRRQSLWHYDGKNFTPYNEYILSATAIMGFAQNNIWMTNAIGQIWHYSGVYWEKDTTLTLEGYNDIVIQSICGTSPNNIYITGMANSLNDYKGIIARYNGKQWQYLDIPYTRANFTVIKYDDSIKMYLMRGINFDNIGSSERLYTLKNNILDEIYSGTNSLYIGTIANRVYIYGNKVIYKYDGTRLIEFLDLSSTNYLGRVTGRSEMDFFCNTFDDTYGIGHWNGTDLATLFISKFKTYRELFFNNEVIFFAGNYENENFNVIIRGKLINN